jgi:hypothetical protein
MQRHAVRVMTFALLADGVPKDQLFPFDIDRAFAALDRAWEIRDSGLLRLKGDPYMDPLRGDPRFAALMKKLDYPA